MRHLNHGLTMFNTRAHELGTTEVFTHRHYFGFRTLEGITNEFEFPPDFPDLDKMVAWRVEAWSAVSVLDWDIHKGPDSEFTLHSPTGIICKGDGFIVSAACCGKGCEDTWQHKRMPDALA